MDFNTTQVDNYSNQIRYKIINSKIIDYPFPHSETNNILSNQLLDEIEKNFPDKNDFIPSTQGKTVTVNSISFNQRLESYYVEKESPTWKPSFIVDENDTYGRIPETKSDERNYDQVVLFSDRITFDARRSNLNVSAHKDINIGVGENFNLNTIGFSVINSGNIYLGREAKRREQPMVLGESLRVLLENFCFL